MNNTDTVTGEVNITKNHPITTGYPIGKYNLSSEGAIYTIKSPVDGTSLGVAAGYSFLSIWEGITYRAAVWSIETSSLTGCTNCLGWNLFYQLLDWVSNMTDIGFEIKTDKEIYTQGETIHISVNAPVDIPAISGNITDPNRTNYELSFSGSGKMRESIYLLDSDDPNGNYTVTILVEDTKRSKDIMVKAFDLNLTIVNQTEEVKIYVNVTDLYGNVINNVDVTINITSPTGSKWSRSYNKTGIVYDTYNISNSGKHKVHAEAVDQYGRKDFEVEYFFFSIKPNITLIPSYITKSITEPGTLNYTVYIWNEGEENLTNIRITKTGEIMSWIELKNTTLPRIGIGEYGILRFGITVPDVERKTYTGSIKIICDQEENELPITIVLKYTGNLSISPSYWEEWLVLGESKTIEFELNNSGKGELIIESINITGDLEDHVSVIEKPSIIDSGKTETLKIRVTTDGIMLGDLSETLYGDMEIVTDLGIYYPLVTLELTVVENLEEKVDSLFGEVADMEKNIKELGDPNLESDLENIKTGLEEVNTFFARGEYENAVNSFELIKNNIDSLKSRIEEKQSEIERRKKGSVTSAIVFLSLVTIAILGYFVLNKLKGRREYGWLYKKWKKFTVRTIFLA